MAAEIIKVVMSLMDWKEIGKEETLVKGTNFLKA